MKTWVMADVVPVENRFYLTPGKWYQVRGGSETGGEIIPDDGKSIFIAFSGSAHINYDNWNVHKGYTPPDAKPSINEQLLEALEDLYNEVCGNYDKKSCGHNHVCVCPGDKARAAIAAAKGE